MSSVDMVQLNLNRKSLPFGDSATGTPFNKAFFHNQAPFQTKRIRIRAVNYEDLIQRDFRGPSTRFTFKVPPSGPMRSIQPQFLNSSIGQRITGSGGLEPQRPQSSPHGKIFHDGLFELLVSIIPFTQRDLLMVKTAEGPTLTYAIRKLPGRRGSMAEHLIRNQGIGGSTPPGGSIFRVKKGEEDRHG